MLKTTISSLFILSVFSGCSWVHFQDGYKTAKVIYKDVKYVVYEVVEEKKQVKAEIAQSKE